MIPLGLAFANQGVFLIRSVINNAFTYYEDRVDTITIFSL